MQRFFSFLEKEKAASTPLVFIMPLNSRMEDPLILFYFFVKGIFFPRSDKLWDASQKVGFNFGSEVGDWIKWVFASRWKRWVLRKLMWWLSGHFVRKYSGNKGTFLKLEFHGSQKNISECFRQCFKWKKWQKKKLGHFIQYLFWQSPSACKKDKTSLVFYFCNFFRLKRFWDLSDTFRVRVLKLFRKVLKLKHEMC